MSYSKKSNLPVEFLPGIGKRTAKVLKSLDVQTIGQFKRMPEGVLVELFGPSIRKTYYIVHQKKKQKKALSFYKKIQLASHFVSLL